MEVISTNGKPMKYILITKSESGDLYHYGIEASRSLNAKNIHEFLQEHAVDRDEERVYEEQEYLILLPNVNFIKY